MSVAQEIVGRELQRLADASKAGELTLDQARKLILYLHVYDPKEEETRPLSSISDDELRAALLGDGTEKKE